MRTGAQEQDLPETVGFGVMGSTHAAADGGGGDQSDRLMRSLLP